MTGSDGVTEAAVDVAYYQYYIYDSREVPDWSRLEFTADGVIAPLETGVVVFSGLHTGDVRVQVTILPEPPGPVPGGVVAAECDIVVPSGVLVVAGWSRLVTQHDFDQPTRCRLRAQLNDRDTATPTSTAEWHELCVWETNKPQSRWRSKVLDQIGQLSSDGSAPR